MTAIEKMAKVMRFRKRPVMIEAIQWTGDNLRQVITFTGLHPSAEKWTWEEYAEVVKCEGLKIFTLEGPLKASIGDWIIRGVAGEFYPCKPDIFEQTYNTAHESSGMIEVDRERLRKYVIMNDCISPGYVAEENRVFNDFLAYVQRRKEENENAR